MAPLQNHRALVGQFNRDVMTLENNTTLTYQIKETLELNLSYMPFVRDGGLFVPTPQSFALGTGVTVDLQLPGKKDSMMIEGKVVWVTPKNALHHVLAGVGVQFVGANSSKVRNELESMLDKSMEVGGYTYGITEGVKGKK